MITYIFIVGQQRKDGDVSKQVSALARLKSNIEAAVVSVSCPNHESGSDATIVLRGLYYGSQWEVLSSCCSEFREAIESAVTSNCGESEKHPY